MNRVTIGATHQRFNSISALLDNVHMQTKLIIEDLTNFDHAEDMKYLVLRASLLVSLNDIENAARRIDGTHHDFQLSLGEGG